MHHLIKLSIVSGSRILEKEGGRRKGGFAAVHHQSEDGLDADGAA